MSATKEYFDKNGYVVLQNAIPKERAEYLTKYMFDMVEQQKTENDDQCPLSDGIYSPPELDRLLEELTTGISQAVGRRLLPTYTYARVYRPGEVLKKHKDRPSCEVSATLTLGYDAKKVWPILFDEEKEISVNLEVGELAVYQGCDVVHWRNEFKGKWHVQVFLHYVDADGPYADCIFDGRGGLSHHEGSLAATKQVEQKTPDVPQEPIQTPLSIRKANYDHISIPSGDMTFPGYLDINNQHWPELKFTEEECDAILKMVEDLYATTSSVGGSKDNSKIAHEIRSAQIFDVEYDEESKWIFDKVTNAVAVANATHFDYEISGISHSLQLIQYRDDFEVPGHYTWHTDSGRGEPATRKISFVAQLSKPEDYEGCELTVNDHGNLITATKERGSMHMFPSYQVHQVSPITKGERFALVIWVHGSRRFR